MNKLLLILFCGIIQITDAQISLSVQSTVNNVCDGNSCEYSGPSILINEVMLAPTDYDGSMIGPGDGVSTTGGGEWIELYNPNLCKPVDISCYYLGNNAQSSDYTDHGGGYRLPNNTIVPAGGFLLVRGVNAPPVASNLLVQNGGRTVELVVSDLTNVCLGGNARLWFPNSGGWFAFYDANGVAQDAISWNSQTNSCMTCPPCIPSSASCSNASSLFAYDDILNTNKNYITSLNPTNYTGLSFKRLPDGGAWASIPTASTMGNCNAVCNPDPIITCDGTASVVVTGGTPPYNYLWNDSKGAITQTANQLCEGSYCVTVTDANGLTQNACVEVKNFVPALSYNGEDYYFSNHAPINIANNFIPFAGTISGDGVTNSIFDPLTAGIGFHVITCIVQDINTCSDTLKVNIEVKEPSKILVPNVFTPNSDGNNDVFKIESKSLNRFLCDIYNRWGKKIYSWENATGNWDGKIDGNDASEGTYYYILTATGIDNVQYSEKGTITLVR